MNTSLYWYSRIYLAGLLAVLGCSDSSSPTSNSQSIDFRYAGGLTGHFRAGGPATAVGDPTRSFAVAFRSAAGETQLCAYQPGWGGLFGNVFLLNIGVINAPGNYSVPPPWAPNATSYQNGTFLLGVDYSHTYVQQGSRFIQGEVEVQELSDAHVRGGFAITTDHTTISEGRFDVLVAGLEELPIICQ
jgi:hypothetical protein